MSTRVTGSFRDPSGYVFDHEGRIFRALDALLGGKEPDVRAWFHAANAHLGGVPAERVQTIPGLVHVAEYLDAMRGKL